MQFSSVQWYQGEQNANCGGPYQSAYSDMLQQLVIDWRAQLQQPSLPFGNMHAPTSTPTIHTRTHICHARTQAPLHSRPGLTTRTSHHSRFCVWHRSCLASHLRPFFPLYLIINSNTPLSTPRTLFSVCGR